MTLLKKKTYGRITRVAGEQAEGLLQAIAQVERSVEQLVDKYYEEMRRLDTLQDFLHLEALRQQLGKNVIARWRNHLEWGDGPFVLIEVREHECKVLAEGRVRWIYPFHLLPASEVELQGDKSDWETQ